MYLHEARVNNDGPIADLTLTLEFGADGNPKPLVVVGENGSGKTDLLSIFADAIVEGASQHHSDVVQASGTTRAFLRLVGGVTVRLGAAGGFALLRFEDAGTSMIFAQKGGHFPIVDLPADLSPGLRPGASWNDDGAAKTFPMSEEDSRRIYSSGSYAYFPASRSESPHWLNMESLPTKAFNAPVSITGRLGRQLFVEHGMAALSEWVPGLLLDSRPEVLPAPPGTNAQWVVSDNEFLRHALTRELANEILRVILDDPTAAFVWSDRFSGLRYRSSRNNGSLALGTLSSGQATLLSIFGTVLLQCDASTRGAPQSAPGICIIDEVDAHVHVDLAYRAIPRLIRLFPRIQFITSAHSPLYVLGMQASFGDDGIQIIEMPGGLEITAEGYREFGNAMQVLRDTQGFDSEVATRMNAQVTPLILCEGETDPKYITTATELLGESSLLVDVVVDWVGVRDAKGGAGAGKDALWRAWQLLTANPDLVGRPVMLLFDNDAKKGDLDRGRVAVRSLPTNPLNAKMATGIENLLSTAAIEDRFYSKNVVDDKKGKIVEIQELDKMSLCAYLCEVKRDVADFAEFAAVVAIIRSWLQTLGLISGPALEDSEFDDAASEALEAAQVDHQASDVSETPE